MNSGCLFYVILFMTITSTLACKSSPPEKPNSKDNDVDSTSSSTTETILYFTKVTPDDNDGQQTENVIELNERPRAANVNNNEIDDNESTVSPNLPPKNAIYFLRKLIFKHFDFKIHFFEFVGIITE